MNELSSYDDEDQNEDELDSKRQKTRQEKIRELDFIEKLHNIVVIFEAQIIE
jgi:hypothetical protein